MSRLWLGNFDFEHQLADPGYNRTAKMRALNAELSAHLLLLADTGDCIHFEERLPDGFLAQAVDAGLIATDINIESDGLSAQKLEPWGWSTAVARDAGLPGIDAALHPKPMVPDGSPVPRVLDEDCIDAAVALLKAMGRVPDQESCTLADAARLTNSRMFSNALESLTDSAIPGKRWLLSLDCFDLAVQLAAETWETSHTELPWIIKADFGMSGRERLIGRGDLIDDKTVNWIERRLQRDRVLSFEPFVTSLDEVSTHWDIPADPSLEITFRGLTGVLCGHLGNVVRTESGHFPRLREDIVNTGRSAAEEVRRCGYSGPLGIDGMIYSGRDGLPVARPIQDINARWTMGRVALKLHGRLRPAGDMHWLHVPTVQLCHRLGISPEEQPRFHADHSLDVTDRWSSGSQSVVTDDSPIGQIDSLVSDGRDSMRLLLTSPLWIGNRSTNRTSVVCLTKERRGF